jgi:Flp pilus assembly protein TadG
MKTIRARRGQLRGRKKSFIADQRGVIAFEVPIVTIVLIFSLLLPLADLAIAGLKFNSAYQALRDMGQRTQYSTPDATDPASISTWQSSLPTTVDGYTVSASVKCGDAGTAPPCAGTTFPKYYSFQTSFSLSPMVLGSVLCSTCTVNYLQRFQ